MKMQLEIAQEVVFRLELARDNRPLAPFKEELKQRFKLRSLALSSLSHTVVMKFFHVHATERCRKNLI
jgi:hypothetical protein